MTFAQLIGKFLEVINAAIPALFALTLALVFWKIVKAWIIDGGDPQSVESGKNAVIVAVIALVFMIGIWGIVEILRTSLGLN